MPPRGRDLRDRVYRDAAALPLAIDSAVARAALASVRGAMSEVREFGGALPSHLVSRIEDAERSLHEAEAAPTTEDWRRAGLYALEAADHLRETSPRSAALTLVEAAEDALGPQPSGAASEPAAAARARRLVWWSRIAIQQEQYSLAIQRGYYACLLLGIRLP